MSSSRMTLARNPRQVAQLEQGSDLNECVVASSHLSRRATPPITARGVDQPCAHRVKLNIPRHGDHVRLVENERREPSLPEMARHPSRKLTIRV